MVQKLPFAVSAAMLGFALLGLPHLGMAAESAPLENSRYEIQLGEDTGECCPRTFHFRVLDKAVGAEKELTLSGRVAELEGMRLAHTDRLVLVGRLRYGGEILLIGDLRSSTQIDTIWAHRFGFSPSKRYLIYHSHHPRHAIPLARKSIVLIYDLASSAKENRRSGFENATYEHMPGWPVYPAANAFRQSYDVRLTDQHHIVSPFLWSSAEDQVAFISRWGNRYEAVLLQLQKFGTPPGIWQQPLNIKDMILPRRKEYMEPQEIENIGYEAEKLVWSSPRQIIAHTHSAYHLLQDKLTIELPAPNDETLAP